MSIDDAFQLHIASDRTCIQSSTQCFNEFFRITYLQIYESQQMYVTERKNAFTERWITFYSCIVDILIEFRISMISFDV